MLIIIASISGGKLEWGLPVVSLKISPHFNAIIVGIENMRATARYYAAELKHMAAKEFGNLVFRGWWWLRTNKMMFTAVD